MMMDMYQVKNIKNLRETVKNMVMNVLNLGCRPNRRKNSIQELQNKLALKICRVQRQATENLGLLFRLTKELLLQTCCDDVDFGHPMDLW